MTFLKKSFQVHNLENDIKKTIIKPNFGIL